ncbi:hypothetical protein [Wolbachia endosymbiont of Tettigetta isshikii]
MARTNWKQRKINLALLIDVNKKMEVTELLLEHRVMLMPETMMV